MASNLMELMCHTVPEEKKEEVALLVETWRKKEEERLIEFNSGSGARFRGRRNVELGECKRKAEKAAVPLAIAVLIKEIWSPKMRGHVEKLIFKKAIEEKYLEEGHQKFIKILDEDEDGDTGWVIEDQDDAIVNLVWDAFNMKEHFCQVQVHRLWIKKSYERVKEFMPSLCPEIIERHDLSKFAFSQAVGYTLKFVHNTYHQIWRQACDFHLQNEPHHPQAWSKAFSPAEKRKKLEIWTRDVCDFRNDCPYGINLVTFDFTSENLADVFLLESYVDMIAVEWERKKGQRLDISTAELVSMDDKFLSRYTEGQHRFISNLMQRIAGLDDHEFEVNLSERDKNLLTAVCEEDKPMIISELKAQKKQQLKLLRQDVRYSTGSARHGPPDEAMRQSADKLAYNIVVAIIVSERWNLNFRKRIENLVLKRAIEEGFIKESHMPWIFVIEDRHRDQAMEVDCDKEYPNIEMPETDLVKLVWEVFNVREHFNQMKEHRDWLMKSFHRLGKYMPELPEEVIERHDLSKFAFSQAIGYTLKWVHGINHRIWKTACDLHLNHEPHHPEMWWNKHTVAYKQSSLETWLCVQGGGAKYGVEISSLNLASEEMAKVFLYESFIDMVAVEWERKKGGRIEITTVELVSMEDKYLNRYSPGQHKFVSNLMKHIAYADTPEEELKLTEKEMCLLSAVREEDKGIVYAEIETKKKEEVYRLCHWVQQSRKQVTEEQIQQRATDNAYRIAVATVVMEYWDHNLRKHVEKLTLQKAVQEGFISENNLQWIFFIEERVAPMENDNGTTLSDISIAEGDLVKIVWEGLNVRELFAQLKTHRGWIMQSFQRLAKYMPELPEEIAERHDLSKFAFSQAIGYTLNWVHGINHPIWRQARDLHLHNEPHHPEMWSKRHSPAYKQSCLEIWLCAQDGGARYGIEISTLSLISEDMALAFLYESFLDMVAWEWDGKRKGRQDLTDWELVNMEGRYLSRYSLSDQARLREVMTSVRKVGQQ